MVKIVKSEKRSYIIKIRYIYQISQAPLSNNGKNNNNFFFFGILFKFSFCIFFNFVNFFAFKALC